MVKSHPYPTSKLLHWQKSETSAPDSGNQDSFAALSSDQPGDGRPNGTLEQSSLLLQQAPIILCLLLLFDDPGEDGDSTGPTLAGPIPLRPGKGAKKHYETDDGEGVNPNPTYIQNPSGIRDDDGAVNDFNLP